MATLPPLAGMLAVFVAGAAGAGGADPSFAPGAPVPVGKEPISLAATDLNGDGKPDLVVTNGGSGDVTDDVTVLLGDGTGGFRAAPGSPVEVGNTPFSVVTADLNGDQLTDLAVANLESKNVSALLGDGAGGFTAAPGSPVTVPSYPHGVTAADLNGDGKVDLALPLYGSRLAILLGDGSGRFAAASGSPIVVRRSVSSVAVADVNGDGDADLAAHNSDKVSILLGNGAGGFAAPRTVLARAGPDRGFVSFADFNRDRKPDLAVTRSAGAVTIQVRVLLGNGRGGFRPVGSPIAVGLSDAGGTVADFNGDGKIDLAIANYSLGVSVLLGNGAGGFRPAADSPFPPPRVADSPFPYVRTLFGPIAAADLNGDGTPDLALTAPDGVTIMFRTPSTPSAVPGGALPGRRDAVFSTRGPITRLEADGNRVAVATGKAKGRCGRVVVWTAPRRKSMSFKTGQGCTESSRGYYVDKLALGGGQVAWIVNTGGNTLELILNVAKLSGRAAREIDGGNSTDDGFGSWVGQLLGGGSLLVYNRWRVVCDGEEGCPPGERRLTEQKLVRISTGRGVVVKRGPDSYPLSAVGGGRMAIESAGAVTVLAPSGSRVATVPAVEGNPPRTIALARTHLAVARTFTLDLYDPATGAEVKSLPLGPAAALQLAGINSKLALLRGPRRLVLVRLSDGKLISLALRPGVAKRLVDTRLSGAGLFYAYNSLRGSAKGRIVFEPTARLLARF